MNKLNKKIIKLLHTYCWAEGGCLAKYKSDEKVISQIKQSILKAIMEEFRKGECMFCNHNGDCDKSILKFESVIKEILGDSKDNKI